MTPPDAQGPLAGHVGEPAAQLPPLDELELLFEQSSDEELGAFLKILHPADLAELLWEIDHDHWPRVFSLLDDHRLADTLVESEGGTRDDLIEEVPDERLARLVSFLESDDAADLVADMPAGLRDRIVGTLERSERRAVEALLAYPEDSAGGIMQAEVCVVSDSGLVRDAIAAIREASRTYGDTLHIVYVVDDDHRLEGIIRLHQLILAEDDERIADIMEPARYQVMPEVDQEEVALLFQKYDLVSLAVVDAEGKLLGRILHDDILDVLEEEMDEDVMRMVGASEEDLVYSDRIFKISAYRLPWLVVNLCGGLVTGWLMWRFKATLGEVLALVTFIPVITAMGGNVGTQSSTILTRGFATGRVDTENLIRVIMKELLIGLIMGAACGSVVAVAAILWHGQPVLGLVVAISMLAAMTTAATIGTVAPATFRRLNIDPAIAAGPFVTTANDITGILIYFGTATFFLEWLVR